jgi:YD repeat-containing protein
MRQLQSAQQRNLLAINDNLNSGQSQTFSYDTLNRINHFTTANGFASQTYSIDPFGNMNQVAPGTFQTNFSFDSYNRISSSGFVYDGAGNMTQSSFAPGMYQNYTYDADSKIVSYNSGAATYQYNPEGARVRKDSAGAWTEYVYFNGQVTAEKHSDGSWTDYIYANGQKIATSSTSVPLWHTHGVRDSSIVCVRATHGESYGCFAVQAAGVMSAMC